MTPSFYLVEVDGEPAGTLAELLAANPDLDPADIERLQGAAPGDVVDIDIGGGVTEVRVVIDRVAEYDAEFDRVLCLQARMERSWHASPSTWSKAFLGRCGEATRVGHRLDRLVHEHPYAQCFDDTCRYVVAVQCETSTPARAAA